MEKKVTRFPYIEMKGAHAKEFFSAMEELKSYRELGTVEEFAELKQAKSDGRLVELPCAAGNTVWVLDRDGAPREMILDEPDIRCHCKKEDNLCMALCDAKNTGVCAYRLKNDGSDLGKKIFLTREAAEAALSEMGDE